MKVELNVRIKGGPLDAHHLAIEWDDDPRYGRVELRLGAERDFGFPVPDDCDSPHAYWTGSARFDPSCDGYVLDYQSGFIPAGLRWLGIEDPQLPDGGA